MKNWFLGSIALCTLVAWGFEELVDTRYGAVTPTGGSVSGRCLLGPCTPHGAISPGPDTLYPQRSKWKYPSPSGFHVGDDVVGFSQLHAHGTGGHPTYGLFLVSPTTDDGLTEESLASPMTILEARPSAFRCCLEKWSIEARVTAARQTALYRFAFAPGKMPRVVVNCARKIGNARGLRTGGLQIAGARISGGGEYAGNWNPAPYDCFFAAEFEKAPVRSGVNEDRTIAWFEFAPEDARDLGMKMAISFTSAEKAQTYLTQELPSWDFTQVRQAAVDQWEEALGTVRATGFATPDEARIFYSNLYHTMIQPRDRTGDVPGWGADESVWDDHYTLWDTWKTLFPLMSIIAPQRYASVVNSFGTRFRHNGECAASYIQTKEYRTGQSGDDVDNVIADAYAKKIPGIDWPSVAAVLRFHAAERTPDYLEKGYVCSDVKHPKYCWRFMSGSGTLGFAYNDWCAAQVLGGLGETDLAARLRARSGNWTNIWDDAVVDAPSGYRGFARGRASDGRWVARDLRTRGNPMRECTPREGFNCYFYEGTSWDYSFTVFNDIPGMIAKMGGRDAFAERLEYALQHNLIEFGNEPSFMTIWMFDFAGRPDRASFWANRLRARFGAGKGGWGIPGDDDSGAMGSLYVFLVSGLFPISGTDQYMLHGPAVKETVFQAPGGKPFIVRAPAAGGDNIFWTFATLNGRPLTEPLIHHADIVAGGVLAFEMVPKK